MSKAVLISIRPKWCELIASGEKTIEVRKTRPNHTTPFKCYIYETKGFERVGNDSLNCVIGGSGRGMVIGEFVCDAIYKIINVGNAFVVGKTAAETNRVALAACLDFGDMHDYFGHKGGQGWHVSKLEIYNEPKKLSEFRRPCHESLYCEGCAMWSEQRGCGNAALQITRPPQSWCYVEELT